MTEDDAAIRKQAVDAIIKAVVRKTVLILSLASVGALLFGLVGRGGRPFWILPASLVFGGALGLVNFRWLAIAVQRVYLRQGASPAGSNIAAVIISLLKLSLIFVILFIVIKWQLLHMVGLVAGLSLCFLAILWEGATMIHGVMRDSEKQR